MVPFAGITFPTVTPCLQIPAPSSLEIFTNRLRPIQTGSISCRSETFWGLTGRQSPCASQFTRLLTVHLRSRDRQRGKCGRTMNNTANRLVPTGTHTSSHVRYESNINPPSHSSDVPFPILVRFELPQCPPQ